MGIFGRPDDGTVYAKPVRVSRSEKFAAYPEWIARVRARWNDKHPGRVKAAEGGSLPALIQLKCLDCCCGQRTEVRDCMIVACPLYPARPFQRGSGEDAEGGDEAEAVGSEP